MVFIPRATSRGLSAYLWRIEKITHSVVFFFSSRRRHTRWPRDWSSDVCSSDLDELDLLRALRIADEFKLKPILFGNGYEYRVRKSLAEKKPAIILPLDFPKPPEKIGRASCRERV